MKTFVQISRIPKKILKEQQFIELHLDYIHSVIILESSLHPVFPANDARITARSDEMHFSLVSTLMGKRTFAADT